MSLGASGGMSASEPRSRFNSADCTFKKEFGSNKVIPQEEERKFPFGRIVALEERDDRSESSQD
jgi:hypothetical protein